MNLGKIDRFFEEKAPHSWTRDATLISWTKDVVQFLALVYTGEISHQRMIALMDIMTSHSIKLRDGMIINDNNDPNRSMWIADVALIASALCSDPDEDATWWKIEFSNFNKESAEYSDLVARMVKDIRRFPHVVAVEPM